jgi:hypothetical protein
MCELRCTRDLAWRLGAISPETIAHHKALRDAGHMLVRDIETSWPMFWPWQLSRDDMAKARTFACRAGQGCDETSIGEQNRGL